MFIGICPYCDYEFVGLELIDPQNLKCPNCSIGRMIPKHNYEPDLGYMSFWVGLLNNNIGNMLSSKDYRLKSSIGKIVLWGEWN